MKLNIPWGKSDPEEAAKTLSQVLSHYLLLKFAGWWWIPPRVTVRRVSFRSALDYNCGSNVWWSSESWLWGAFPQARRSQAEPLPGEADGGVGRLEHRQPGPRVQVPRLPRAHPVDGQAAQAVHLPLEEALHRVSSQPAGASDRAGSGSMAQVARNWFSHICKWGQLCKGKLHWFNPKVLGESYFFRQSTETWLYKMMLAMEFETDIWNQIYLSLPNLNFSFCWAHSVILFWDIAVL